MSETKPIKAVAMFLNKMRRQRMAGQLKNVLRDAGIVLEVEGFENLETNHETVGNLITWGTKWTHEEYTRNGKNILFIENGLFRQGESFFVDHQGYFADSAFCTEQYWKKKPTKAEKNNLERAVKNRFGWDLFQGGDPEGPVMIAWQTPRDAPVKHYFPAGEGRLDKNTVLMELAARHLPSDVPVIFRPHPKDSQAFNRAEWEDYIQKGWRPLVGGDVYRRLRKCSGLITINSTLATEALALGIPVATLGDSIFTGSGAVLECSQDPSKLAEWKKFKPNRTKIEAYLCAILRHELPKSAGEAEVGNNKAIKVWIDRARRSKEFTTAIAMVTSKPKVNESDLRPDDPFLDMVKPLRQLGMAIGKAKIDDSYPRQPTHHYHHSIVAELESGAVDKVILGFAGMAHLGDTLCTSSLPRKLKEKYGCKVYVVKHKTTKAVFENNPYVDGYRVRNSIPLGLRNIPRKINGHYMHCLEAYFGLELDRHPRPEVYLDEAELNWAQAVKKLCKKPMLVLSPNVVTRRASSPFHSWDWQPWVDKLAEQYTIVHPVITLKQYKEQAKIHSRDENGWQDQATFTNTKVLADLSPRQYMSLFAVADAYFGSHAAGSHLAAAFGVPAITCSSQVPSATHPYPPSAHLGRWLYPQHLYGAAAPTALKPLYLFFSMKRSGQHAIINWCCKQHTGAITFHNNCDKNGKPCGRRTLTYAGGGQWAAYNFEDFDIRGLGRMMGKGKFQGGKAIVIIRDIFNMVASSYQRKTSARSNAERDVYDLLPERVEKWKDYARLCLDPPEGVLVINYNQWFEDAAYRQEFTEQQLKLAWTDAGINEIPDFGNGSSFQGRSLHKKAQDMSGVLERWKRFERDAEFWSYIDSEAIELNKQVFGWTLRIQSKESE